MTETDESSSDIIRHERTDSLVIGKDQIELSSIIGKAIGSTFKLIPKVGLSRQFSLQLCTSCDKVFNKDSLKDVSSGSDNRNLCDDGSSQLLTKDSIEDLRDSGLAPQAILGQLVVNSKTFQKKTEFSQEKYIEKKEKKYFEFVSVKLPTIRVLAEILYNRDIPKSVGIRIDTLSQFATALNFQSTGHYILVESGYRGMVAATLLNLLSGGGKLVHITPENQNQKQAVLAMNFSTERLSQLTTIRLSTFTELLKKNISISEVKTTLNSKLGNFKLETSEVQTSSSTTANINFTQTLDEGLVSKDDGITHEEVGLSCNGLPEVRKRKNANEDVTSEIKKPRWMTEAEISIDIITQKVDGLIVVCKEFPAKIVDKLLQYVLPSRPFVVYSIYQEPLVSMFIELKKRKDIINLRITETLFRPYQILPERSHPVVTINSSSGFLLSGIKVMKDPSQKNLA